ncbi:MAG: MaoC family dehydratase [Actinobacteria bacterium]|nr:MaoC family dehydratase [Actinomycetota bacterium]
MAITAELIGRVFGPTAPTVLNQESLVAFAAAVGVTDPVCVDAQAAAEAGYRAIVAAPTYPIVLTLDGAAELSRDPAIGLDFSHVVHGDQRFEYHQPLCAGDTVTVTTTVEDVKSLAGNTVVTVRGDVRLDGSHVACSAWTTLVVRPVEGSAS